MRTILLAAACGLATLLGPAARAEVELQIVELCKPGASAQVANLEVCVEARTTQAQAFCQDLDDEDKFPMDVNGDTVIEETLEDCVAVVSAPDPAN